MLVMYTPHAYACSVYIISILYPQFIRIGGTIYFSLAPLANSRFVPSPIMKFVAPLLVFNEVAGTLASWQI